MNPNVHPPGKVRSINTVEPGDLIYAPTTARWGVRSVETTFFDLCQPTSTAFVDSHVLSYGKDYRIVCLPRDSTYATCWSDIVEQGPGSLCFVAPSDYDDPCIVIGPARDDTIHLFDLKSGMNNKSGHAGPCVVFRSWQIWLDGAEGDSPYFAVCKGK